MNGSQVLAFLLCERVVLAPGAKPTLHGIFDRVQLRSGSEKNGTFFVFYKVRLSWSGRLELRVLGPVKDEVARRSDNLPSAGLVVTQSFWTLTLGRFTQNGTYTFELWDDAAHRLAYTELSVERL